MALASTRTALNQLNEVKIAIYDGLTRAEWSEIFESITCSLLMTTVFAKDINL